MSRMITFIDAVREAQEQKMEQDERVYIIGEDIGEFGGAFGATKGLWQKYGAERVRDAAISEEAIIGSSVGTAMTGMRPIAEIQFSDFMTICMDQIVNQAAKIRYMFGGRLTVPLVIRAPIGGYIFNAAQHSQSLEAWFCHVPGLVVVIPSTPYDAKGLLISSIERDDPVMFFEHKKLYWTKGDVPEEMYTVPIGKAERKREGEDITIITYAYTTNLCLEACAQLEKEGIHAGLVDLRTVSPIDRETIFDEVCKTGRALVVHEASRNCGVGAEVSSLITEHCFSSLKAPIIRIGAKHSPVPYSPVLEKAVLPQVEDIVAAAKKTVEYS
jgi:pyruvate/2-oxoglutarate/acetoin dehydrogenase E1 component